MMRDVSSQQSADRVGLGWRPEIGVRILDEIGSIDILEITAENCAHLSNKELGAFARLTNQVDVVIHALSLGMASTYTVSKERVESVARVVNAIGPEAWSEHLAFVRTPECELHHLAAPPWTEETAAMAIRNVELASKIVGSRPHLENIARLYNPPGSTLSETDWTKRILAGAKTKLLIDLQNIYANCRNFQLNWFDEMRKFPLQEVFYVHIAGGKEIEDSNGKYFVDDHLHPVADDVYKMLEELARICSSPITVILERDGNFHDYTQIRTELHRSRTALERGRKKG